ncbi:ABC transporter substrate-binding protein [Kutzneria chonburiensis]|uniref:ABC transporter substrate-binding protein n=1 Tax=Kutzneria chonburiensis TaxID=1483604 RepID=A0ABV6MPG1_9PSEU|nr:ABC transporter substrate-binding protein [Kutzneria chonburiensis]
MRVSRRVVFAVAGSLMAATALTACGGGGSTAKGNADGVLNVGMPNGPQTDNNNPYLSSSAANSLGYKNVIFEPLALFNKVKPTDDAKPWLATKWDWSNNYQTLTLTVRDNVKWSDGQAFSADDVKFTFDLLKATAGLNHNAIPFGDTTVSGSTVTATFTSPQFVNEYKILTDTPIVPKHQWSTFKDPATDPVKDPVGTGPFKLKTFTPQTVTLDVRSDYWKDAPKVKELRYTSYTDNNAQATALATGACEWAFAFIPNAKQVFVSKDPAHNQLYFPPDLAGHGLWFNTTKAPFDNPALRQAINMVINRDDIFNQGESGYFYPPITNITGIPTPAGNSFLAPEYKSQDVKVDVAGAKAKLTGAGFTFDGNTLKDPTGKPVTMTLSDPAGWSDYQTDLEIIKDNVSKIGITATVDKANQDAWTKNVDTGNFDAVLHWTDGGATPYQLYKSIMDGDLYKPVGTPGVNGNYGRFQNADATAALKAYASAADDAGRTAAMNKLQKIFVDNMPVALTSASNLGGEYSTKNWTGWPTNDNPYADAHPTLPGALDVILNLKPAA